MAVKKFTRTGAPCIDSEEKLLRRVPPCFYPDRDHQHQPTFDAFLPRRWKSTDDPGDHNGLSVNRECLTTIENVSKHPDTHARQNVVRTSVPKVQSLGLTVIENALDNDISHALIPELNSLDYKSDRTKKAEIKKLARKLAFELSEIVYLCVSSECP